MILRGLTYRGVSTLLTLAVIAMAAVLLAPEASAQSRRPIRTTPHELPYDIPADSAATAVTVDSVYATPNGLQIEPLDTLPVLSQYDVWEERAQEFNPDPTRAVWMAALFPGLGQVYNRRYWKLPIVVGAYLGLGYGTSWNNKMLRDYTQAYRDIMDNDPDTRSYMDFFPNNYREEDLDRQWLQNVLKSRKDYYRRNRDLCIISMVGVYLLAMVDAYVDASLSHFDISPNLSMDVAPALMPDARNPRPCLGLVWAFNF